MAFSEFHTRLSAKVGISDDQSAALERYFELLLKWNRKINLTALSLDPLSEEALQRLFVEPLQAVSTIRDADIEWYDLGSGGGSPAIPIKVVRPRMRLTMVESRGRKAAFLNEVIRELGLADARVENVRFEDLQTQPETVDLITVRAVRTDEVLTKICSRLLKTSGKVIRFGTDVRIVPRETLSS